MGWHQWKMLPVSTSMLSQYTCDLQHINEHQSIIWNERFFSNIRYCHTEQNYKMSKLHCMSWQFTWRVCTLVLCLWIPFPLICSVYTVHSGEYESALSGPPYLHRSASLSASRSHSDFHFPLTYTSMTQIKKGQTINNRFFFFLNYIL